MVKYQHKYSNKVIAFSDYLCYNCLYKINYYVMKMKILSSLKSAKTRDKNCKIVRRKGTVYVINKQNPKFKAKQA